MTLRGRWGRRIVRTTQIQLSDGSWFYAPQGAGKRSALLLLHGSEGGWSGWSHRDAVLFAQEGFLAYPLVYSKGGNLWNAGDIEEVPIETVVAALAALRGASNCNGKVGIYGVSRGAELALLTASLMALENLPGQPDAVAVHSAPDTVCGAFIGRQWRDVGDPGWQAWDPAQRAWNWRGTSEQLKPTTPIPIEAYRGPLFLSHGTRDEVWSSEMTKRLETRLLAAGRRPAVQFYEGQGHNAIGVDEVAHFERVIAFFQKAFT